MKKIISFLLLYVCFVVSSIAQPVAGKTYLIVSCKYSGMYICEEADGTMVVSSKDNTKRMFWTFETANADEGTFYIKNTVSGNYVQSCNKTPSSSSIMKTGTTPVAYYVGKSASGEVSGKYWFSSTDCSNYNDNTQTPRGLNKDGASSNVIVWNAGVSNTGSYWDLEETEDVFDIRPFEPATDMEHLAVPYHIVSPEGRYLAKSNEWVAPTEAENVNWYFVGTSNSTGYQIVSEAGKEVLAESGFTKWCVSATSLDETDNSYYKFTAFDDASHELTIGGIKNFFFKTARTRYTRSLQTYNYPCGEKSGQYFSKVLVTGAGASRFLTYPMRYKTATSTASQVVVPTSWYTISVMDKPLFKRGKEIDLDLTLQKTPTSADRVFVYFDWDRNGVFETAYELEVAKTMAKTVLVPADAAIGKSRMRLRTTNNSLADADDDVIGQTLDFAIEVCENNSDEFQFTVDVNDSLRGSVSYDETNVTATPYNASTFVCWKEGAKVMSVRPSYAYTLNHDLHLTAYFAADKNDPFGQQVLTGLKEGKLFENNFLLELENDNRMIKVRSGEPVSEMRLYDVNGVEVARVKGNAIKTHNLIPSTYILKVFTKKQNKTLKVSVK